MAPATHQPAPSDTQGNASRQLAVVVGFGRRMAPALWRLTFAGVGSRYCGLWVAGWGDSRAPACPSSLLREQRDAGGVQGCQQRFFRAGTPPAQNKGALDVPLQDGFHFHFDLGISASTRGSQHEPMLRGGSTRNFTPWSTQGPLGRPADVPKKKTHCQTTIEEKKTCHCFSPARRGHPRGATPHRPAIQATLYHPRAGSRTAR
jgi:hypothetical protein